MKKLLACVLIMALTILPLTACGGGTTATPTPEPTQSAEPTPEPTATAEPEPEIPDSSDSLAYIDIVDAQAMGILNSDYDGSASDVTVDQTAELLAAAYSCAQAVGMTVGEAVAAPEEAPTRADFALLVYDFLASIELPEADQPTGHEESFLRTSGVLYDDGSADMQAGCTVDEGILMLARAVTYAAFANDTVSQGLMWEVSDEDTTVYLLGSIHVDDDTLYPFSRQIVDAVLSSDAIVLEIDMGDAEGLAYMQEKSVYSEGDALSNHVSADTIAKLMEVYAEYGITEAEQLDVYKPWALASEISNLAIYKQQDTSVAPLVIDTYVYYKALLSGIEIMQIESYQSQTDLLDGISDAIMENYLLECIAAYNGEEQEGESFTEMLAGMLSAWRVRDAEAFAAVYDKDAYEDEMSIALFEGRDDTMSAYVKTLLEESAGQYFVTVGAGHMVGENGIVAQLISAGYEVNLCAVN